MQKMNKRAMSQRVMGAIILSTIFIILALGLMFGFVDKIDETTDDTLSRINAFILDKFHLLTKLTSVDAVDPFLESEYFEISADKVDCDVFIDFGKDKGFPIEDCPYVQDQCSDKPLVEQSRCVDGLSDSDIEKECNLKSFCKERPQSFYPRKYYIGYQLAHLIERCRYKSATIQHNLKAGSDVPCFDIYLDYSQNVYYQDVYDISKHIKSYYTPTETSWKASGGESYEHSKDKIFFGLERHPYFMKYAEHEIFWGFRDDDLGKFSRVFVEFSGCSEKGHFDICEANFNSPETIDGGGNGGRTYEDNPGSGGNL
jgi:hypothetical protein